jgi:uncharacterized OB-fold protein
MEHFPPRVVCQGCGGREFETIKLGDRGKLVTYTVIRVAPSEFSEQSPYAVGVVELPGGVRMTGQIADCEFDELRVGMPVKIEFRKIREEGEAGIICYGYKFVPER